jgi:hypothetical protein
MLLQRDDEHSQGRPSSFRRKKVHLKPVIWNLANSSVWYLVKAPVMFRTETV